MSRILTSEVRDMSDTVELQLLDGGKEEICPYALGIKQLVNELKGDGHSEEIIKHALAAYAQMHQITVMEFIDG